MRSSEAFDLPGASHLVIAEGVAQLHPEDAMLEAMLTGWEQQQLSRNLTVGTIDSRLKLVRRFHDFTNEYPWDWSPSDIEAWTALFRNRPRGIAASTVRTYQQTIGNFLGYVIDPRYGWTQRCLDRFGRAPRQICHEWNMLRHSSEYEGTPGNRPMTREELRTFFEYADDQVERALIHRRKGWLAAFRDATLFKTAYAWGLRRREVAMLDVSDFTRNPAAPELGRFGMLSVRWGKAHRGGPPRRRNVLTIMPWSVDVVREYLEDVRPRYHNCAHPALWLTERGGRLPVQSVNERFGAYRSAIGLPAELSPHCLRHSYVTHLIEDSVDQLFVQQQVGHSWGSTTALYTGVSSDFKNRALRNALDRAFEPPDKETT